SDAVSVHGGTISVRVVCTSATCELAAVSGTATIVADGPLVGGVGVVPEQAAAIKHIERARIRMPVPTHNGRGRCNSCQPRESNENTSLGGSALHRPRSTTRNHSDLVVDNCYTVPSLKPWGALRSPTSATRPESQPSQAEPRSSRRQEAK